MQTPKFISLEEVLELHDDQISSFGGTPGVRDEGLLESALAQPQATFGGELLSDNCRTSCCLSVPYSDESSVY